MTDYCLMKSQRSTDVKLSFSSDYQMRIVPEDAVVMGSTWHRSIRRTDWQVDVRLSRLSIHRLGLCSKTGAPPR